MWQEFGKCGKDVAEMRYAEFAYENDSKVRAMQKLHRVDYGKIKT
tara:strand:- start:338 stop:472 length:135 start_codon:yes stop_codon:yes gene_type:complete